MIDQLLDAVRQGAGRALVVRGEPGVGKTALLEYLVDRAAGCRLARGSPTVPWPAFHTAHRERVLSLELPRPQVETNFAARHHCSFWAAG